jgi:hypothetical protein
VYLDRHIPLAIMRRGRDMVRRPSSSAETSIDEDTADQLLADDFSVPTNPVVSRPGTMSYARPTSSAFDYPRRTPSMASSSQGQTPMIPQSPPTRNSQFSTTNTEQDSSYPPSVAFPAATTALPYASNYSSTHSFAESDANPFSDPPELSVATQDIAPQEILEPEPVPVVSEKQPRYGVPTLDEPPPRKTFLNRKTIICLIVTAILLLLVVVLVPIGVLVLKPKGGSSNNSDASVSSTGGLTKPDGRDPSALGIPQSAVGTVLDSTKWLDWTDFNVTYTNATVGGLSLMVYSPYMWLTGRA